MPSICGMTHHSPDELHFCMYMPPPLLCCDRTTIRSTLRSPLGQDSGNQRPGDAPSWKFDDFHGSLRCLHLIESGGINVLGEGELMFSLVRSPMPARFCITEHSERMMSISTNSPFLMASIILALKPSLPLDHRRLPQ